MPATTKKNVQPSNTIEYQRQVINDMAGDLQSLFVGTAAINAASVQVAGADIGAISDHEDKTTFFYYGNFTADATISSPKKLAEILSHEDSTCDIANGINVIIDEGCELVISDQDDYAFFSNYTERTNPQKLGGFADNVRQAIIKDTGLTGSIRVGYIPVPSYATDCPVDIEDTFTYTIDDGATLII